MHLAPVPDMIKLGDPRFDRAATGPLRAEDGLNDDAVDIVAVVLAIVFVTLIALAC